MTPGVTGKNRGSAMVWAICSMLIIAALAAAILMAASYYGGATLREESLRRARLTALSAVDTVFAAMEQIEAPAGSFSGPDAVYAALRDTHSWLPPINGESAPADFSLDFGPEFGQVEALSFTCASKGGGLFAFVITVTATHNGQSQTRSLAAALEISGPPYALRWGFEYYR